MRGPRRPDRRPPRREAPPRDALEVTYGLRAGLAVCARRGEEVTRLAYSRAVAREVEPATARLRARGVPCLLLDEDELERIARSAQNEGLCVEAHARRWLPAQALGDHLLSSRGAAIATDRVRNSYNLGAILRSAAFFGVEAMLLGAPAPHPGLDANAVRVAEGGAEHVALSRTTDLADTLGRLRQRGVRVVGAAGDAAESALSLGGESGHRFVFPVVLVVGNEREGLSERVRAQCDALVAIRGSGAVESLNVAVAAGVLAAQLSAQR